MSLINAVNELMVEGRRRWQHGYVLQLILILCIGNKPYFTTEPQTFLAVFENSCDLCAFKRSAVFFGSDRSESFLFLTGTLLGGAYEYLCSVFTELVFGKVFWDYSRIPFNLGGRINLLYCFFWGIAAVVWFKRMFPKIEMLIEKIPVVSGKVITWLLLVFMVCNIGVSCMALVRYDERSRENKVSQSIKIESGNKKSDEKDLKAWQKWMDEHYDDAKMKKIYPNAKKA